MRKWWHWNKMRKEKSIWYSAEWTSSAKFYDFITFPMNSRGKVPRVIITAVPSLRSGSARQHVKNFFWILKPLKPRWTFVFWPFSCRVRTFFFEKTFHWFDLRNTACVLSSEYLKCHEMRFFFISQWNTNEMSPHVSFYLSVQPEKNSCPLTLH